jgi:hypothetical protein
MDKFGILSRFWKLLATSNVKSNPKNRLRPNLLSILPFCNLSFLTRAHAPEADVLLQYDLPILLFSAGLSVRPASTAVNLSISVLLPSLALLTRRLRHFCALELCQGLSLVRNAFLPEYRLTKFRSRCRPEKSHSHDQWRPRSIL